jgi:hypothetical protein
MITIQNKVTDTSCKITSLDSVIDRIRTGGKQKDRIGEIRKLFVFGTKDEYDAAKKTLPVIIFQGEFDKRAMSGLKKSSGLMILDFDHIANDFKETITKLPFVYIAFYSVSGEGVKALVQIPLVKSDVEYKEYFMSMQKYFDENFPNTLDPSGKDISRACFFTYDPDLYKNPDAIIWNQRIETTTGKVVQQSEYVHNDYAKIQPALNFIRSAVVGQRHTNILKSARLVGGYVASGFITESEAERLLKQEAYNIDKNSIEENYRAITDGIKHGMQEPIYDELEKEILDYEQYGKLYFTGEDVVEEIDEKFSVGISRGYPVGFDCLNDLYTVKFGATTYIYGSPFSGKTQFWLEILVNLSKFYGMNHAIFSPETGTAGDVYIELYEIYTKNDFYNNYNRQMSANELSKAKEFINSHFYVIDPGDRLLSVDDFYTYVDVVERKLNIKIHTTLIDPWNELVHNFGDKGRQDIYLEWTLGKIRQNAKINDRHNAIITHITAQQKVKDSDTGMMYFPAADFREVSGGQSWSRKGMSMINVWRPIKGLLIDGDPAPDNMTQVFVQKVKPKGVGQKGSCNLYYDFTKHSFYEERFGERIYAHEQGSAEPIQQEFSYYVPQGFDDPQF